MGTPSPLRGARQTPSSGLNINSCPYQPPKIHGGPLQQATTQVTSQRQKNVSQVTSVACGDYRPVPTASFRGHVGTSASVEVLLETRSHIHRP